MNARARIADRRIAGFMLLPVVLLLTLVAAMAFLGNRETGLASAMAGGATDQDKARYAAEAGLHRAIVKMHGTGCGGTYPIILLSPVQDTAFDGGKYYAYAGALSGSPVTLYSTGTYGDASITLTRPNVPMHQTTATTMTLQPGAEGIDTYVDLPTNTKNYGGADVLWLSPAWDISLLKFDLAAIPAGAHVTSAQLSLYASNGNGSGAVTVHRMTDSWIEGTANGGGAADGATWSTSDTVKPWINAGGDFHSDAVATTTFATAASGLSWDITALVDRWVKGSLPNQGVAVAAQAGVNSIKMVSGENSATSQRPKLTVTFLPPCGWTPPDTTVTLSPLADVDIDKNIPNTNFGAEPDLYLSKGYEAHPLLKFDVSSIMAGKTVKSATLRLYFSVLHVNGVTGTKTSKSLNLNVHTVTKSWKELEATWWRRVLFTNWTTQGGDYLATAVTSKTLAANTAPGIWVEFTVTPLVQEWVDGVTTNNGLILVLPTTSTEELIFNSREAASNRPELVVTYQ